MSATTPCSLKTLRKISMMHVEMEIGMPNAFKWRHSSFREYTLAKAPTIQLRWGAFLLGAHEDSPTQQVR
jgi:hypothetical protein